MNEKRGDVMSTLEWSRSDDEGCEFVGREHDTPTVDKVKKIIINALENKNYDWRTIDGIVRETALPAEEVRDMIKNSQKMVLSFVHLILPRMGLIYTRPGSITMKQLACWGD